MPLPRTGGIAAALVLSLAALAAGCTSSDDAGPTPRPVDAASPAPRPSPALAAYYRQRLDWTACRDGDRCAELRVPLDYAKPAGRSIKLSLLKVPASGRSRHLGSLVVNPGGPGVSGVDYAAAAGRTFGAPLLRSYDVVGFDPRGVGRSTPVECGSDEQLTTLVESDPAPDTSAERRRSDGMVRALGLRCLRDSGDLTRHVSTIEVAKDLDILRAALGEDRLVYLGASYGTFIGATYADLFPSRVGRLVLDGALDPTSTTVEVNLVQAHGFEVALRAYVAACVEAGKCFLGDTVEQGVRRISTFLREVEATPLRTSSQRTVTAGEAVYGLWYPLYDKRTWSVLDAELQAAFRGDGSLLLRIADAYLHRDERDHYVDNSFEVFNAVNCLDRDDAPPSSGTDRLLPRFEKASPTFGSIFAYGVSACHSWPVHSGRQPSAVRAKGSAPIMVVGTTRDPATPLVWARSLARQLDNAVLVTRDGDGHTGYRQGSECVDDAVERYLVSGTVPGRDVTCS